MISGLFYWFFFCDIDPRFIIYMIKTWNRRDTWRQFLIGNGAIKGEIAEKIQNFQILNFKLGQQKTISHICK